MMKGRYVFKINKKLTTDELFEIMEEHWNTKRFQKPVKGMLWKTDYEEFIILPATYQHVIIIYTNKNKVVMNSAWPKTDLPREMAEKITYSSEFPAGTDPVAHYIQVLADKTGSLIAVSVYLHNLLMFQLVYHFE